MNHDSRIAEFGWDLNSLPFIWTSLESPSNGVGIPDALPFSLRIDPATGTLRQAENESVARALDMVYAKGSVCSPMNDGSTIGKSYTEDFLCFALSVLGHHFNGMKVLDIGAGAGYLAHRFQEQGAEVTGIEPGEHGQEGARKYGVKIIKDCFPSPRITGKFDLITMYAVLEHVQDPVAFLDALKPYRHEHSRLLLSVPDCQPYLERGDISVLIHEHWQYFTAASLKNVFTLSGACDLRMQKAGFGGCIYAAMSFSETPSIQASKADGLTPDLLQEPVEQAYRFQSRAECVNAKVVGYLNAAQQHSETVGIYIPGRAMNALIATKVGCSHCRFFDDNENAWGTYFPGVDIPVESRGQLLADPTDRVLIMSLSFGDRIKRELEQQLPPRVAITTLAELLDKPAASAVAA